MLGSDLVLCIKNVDLAVPIVANVLEEILDLKQERIEHLVNH